MSIVASASLNGFFQEVVDGAARTTRVEMTNGASQYVVLLLSDYAKPGHRAGETLERPLTFLLNDALTTSNPGEKFERLKTLGDGVLYASGFFGDHFERRGVDPRYIEGIGKTAYDAASGMLSNHGEGRGLDIFRELAAQFHAIVRVLAEVANLTVAKNSRTSQGVLQIYERWLKTGSESLAQALSEQGVSPVRGVKGTLQ